MANHLRVELALDAFAVVMQHRRPVHHRDRDSQYTAGAYRAALANRGIVVSMSRAGACLDNARAACFFATLKAARVEAWAWPTRAAARQALFEWIAVWHNRQRRHSAVDFRSPVAWLLLQAPGA